MALLDLTCGRVCCLCDQQCTISDAGHLQRNGTDDEEDHFCGEIHACPHTCEMEGCCDIVSAGHGHHKVCMCAPLVIPSLGFISHTHRTYMDACSSKLLFIQHEKGIRKRWYVFCICQAGGMMVVVASHLQMIFFLKPIAAG